jgi:hypothetical protein
VRTVEIEGRRLTYASDVESAAAITDIGRRIGAAGDVRRRILTSASKGL